MDSNPFRHVSFRYFDHILDVLKVRIFLLAFLKFCRRGHAVCTLGHDAKVATACPECKRKTAEHFAKIVFDKAENDPSRNRKISPRAAAAEKAAS